MARAHRLCVGTPLVAFLAVGCFGVRHAPQIRYYTVAIGTEGGDAAPHLPFAVRVDSFGAAPAYRSTRIALRRSKYRLDYYDFSRWAANPQSLLAATVQNYFDRIGTPTAPDPITVSGRIDRLEAVTRSEGLRAVAAITFEARRGHRSLLQRTYLEKAPVEGNDPEDVVAALSKALDRVFARLAADLAAAESVP
jgi:ABC-type uncharacterized transport system auxiliary subunit